MISLMTQRSLMFFIFKEKNIFQIALIVWRYVFFSSVIIHFKILIDDWENLENLALLLHFLIMLLLLWKLSEEPGSSNYWGTIFFSWVIIWWETPRGITRNFCFCFFFLFTLWKEIDRSQIARIFFLWSHMKE